MTHILAFEDFQAGQVYELGAKTVTREEVIAFASRYDAQPMHLDEAAAKDSLLGGLAASGWHTIAMFMRLLVDNLLSRSRSLGAPGIDRLRWVAPVRPGDVLVARTEILETRASSSRPGVGIVRFRSTVATTGGTTVMTMENAIFFAARGQPAEAR